MKRSATLTIVGLSLSLAACGTQTSSSGSGSLLPATPETEAAAAAAVASVAQESKLVEPGPVVRPVDLEPVAHKPVAHKPVAVQPKPKPKPMFATPEAAMRFLAMAYNTKDEASLKKVTTPEAREALEDMRPIAPRLTFEECIRTDGIYYCNFTHTYPEGSRHDHGDDHEHGTAGVQLAAADKPGWYMRFLISCS